MYEDSLFSSFVLIEEFILHPVRVVTTEEKMKKTCLKWFGHAKRRPLEAPIRKVNQTE